jgi:hypothetical protein
MRILSLVFIVGASLMGLAACDGGGGGTGGGGGGDQGGAGGGTAGNGTGGGTGGSAPGAGYCGKSCAAPADCCPAGSMGCPGDYPNNWTCDSGTCGAPQCASDMDCTFGGVLMGYSCLTANSYKICAIPCTADADCSMVMLTCVGTDDSGAKYCSSDTSTGGCTADADCAGYGKCNTASGACECTADAECTATGTDKCVL